MQSFSEFIVEANTPMQVGDWVRQKGSDYVAYARLMSKQKNGGFKAAIFMSDVTGYSAGKAKFGSTKGWYPNPEKIDVKDVPPKVKKKIDDKTGPMDE